LILHTPSQSTGAMRVMSALRGRNILSSHSYDSSVLGWAARARSSVIVLNHKVLRVLSRMSSHAIIDPPFLMASAARDSSGRIPCLAPSHHGSFFNRFVPFCHCNWHPQNLVPNAIVTTKHASVEHVQGHNCLTRALASQVLLWQSSTK
jgi:hypothetical protein